MVGDRVFRDEMFAFLLEQAPIMGQIAMQHFGKLKDEDVENKWAKDPVTIADLAVRDHFVPTINKKFKNNVLLLSEESSESFVYIPGQKKPIVTCDELDGTVNFKNGKPGFSILLGLAEYIDNGYKITAAVVYKPVTNEIFMATLDTDAFHKHGNTIDKIVVSNREQMIEGVTPLGVRDDSLTFPPKHKLKYKKVIETMYAAIPNNPQAINYAVGSMGLEIALAAKGEIDAILCAKAANWDYVPSLILQQAGGKSYVVRSINDIRNPKLWSLQLDIPTEYYPAIFTNGKIDKQLFEYLQRHIK